MEKKNSKNIENDIIYSQTLHAGNRIYYVDVKKTRSEDMFVTVTESKKLQQEKDGKTEVSFEKHKLFVYKEDLAQFLESLQKAMRFISEQQGMPAPRIEPTPEPEAESTADLGEEIKINIEF